MNNGGVKQRLRGQSLLISILPGFGVSCRPPVAEEFLLAGERLPEEIRPPELSGELRDNHFSPRARRKREVVQFPWSERI